MEWIRVEDKPFLRNVKTEKLKECVSSSYEFDDGFEFLGAVPLASGGWDIHHYVLIAGSGLMVVTDDDTEPAGWEPIDITHYIEIQPPEAVE